VLGHGPLGAGLRVLPWTATLFFVAPVAGALVDRYGPRRFIGAGLALQAIGFSWVALVADHASYAQMIPALMVAGAGVSMAMPATMSASVNAVSEEHVGKAAGVNSTLRQLGGVFGIAITVAVFAGAGGYASFADGFERALLVASGFSLAGALCAVALPNRRGAAHPAAVAEAASA
jgi:MFS family permease